MFILSGDPGTGAASMYFDSARAKSIVSTQASNTSFILPLQKGTVLYTRNVSTTTYRVFYYVSN